MAHPAGVLPPDVSRLFAAHQGTVVHCMVDIVAMLACRIVAEILFGCVPPRVRVWGKKFCALAVFLASEKIEVDSRYLHAQNVSILYEIKIIKAP